MPRGQARLGDPNRPVRPFTPIKKGSLLVPKAKNGVRGGGPAPK